MPGSYHQTQHSLKKRDCPTTDNNCSAVDLKIIPVDVSSSDYCSLYNGDDVNPSEVSSVHFSNDINPINQEAIEGKDTLYSSINCAQCKAECQDSGNCNQGQHFKHYNIQHSSSESKSSINSQFDSFKNSYTFNDLNGYRSNLIDSIPHSIDNEDDLDIKETGSHDSISETKEQNQTPNSDNEQDLLEKVPLLNKDNHKPGDQHIVDGYRYIYSSNLGIDRSGLKENSVSTTTSSDTSKGGKCKTNKLSSNLIRHKVIPIKTTEVSHPLVDHDSATHDTDTIQKTFSQQTNLDEQAIELPLNPQSGPVSENDARYKTRLSNIDEQKLDSENGLSSKVSVLVPGTSNTQAYINSSDNKYSFRYPQRSASYISYTSGNRNQHGCTKSDYQDGYTSTCNECTACLRN